MTRPEFDLLYSHVREKSDSMILTEDAENHEEGRHSKEDDEGDLLLEAYVHRSRTEELEKRLNLQQSNHLSAAVDLQAR
jgi:hypothetical protein